METNTISINKKVLDTSKIIEVNGDVIVPDIKPDIVNIINTNGNAYIYKEDINQGRMRIDGNIDTYVIYLSENGETRSMQTTLNFIESLDNDSISDGMYYKLNVSLERIESKILNERKITIKATLRVRAEFYERSSIDISNQFDDMNNIEKLEESIDVRSIIGMNAVKSSIKEDISIDNSLEVAEILKTNVSLSNIENKISYNKVLAKADANVKIIFLTEDERISTVETSIPLMSFIDIENVSENNICNVDYVIRNMLFKVNSKEMHSISCQVDFEITCEAFEIKNINIIQDMYSTKNNLTFSKREAQVQTNSIDMCENVQINENLLVEDINSIYDVDCTPVILSNTPSGSFTNYEGEVILDIYFEADNRNGLNVKNVKIPFIAKMENKSENIIAKITRKQFTVNNEYVNCELEVSLSQNSTSMKKINIIENVEQQECEEPNDYKMVIYFVKANDTIWNIAKKFKVCKDSILSVNNLDSNYRLNIGDKLYIMQ